MRPLAANWKWNVKGDGAAGKSPVMPAAASWPVLAALTSWVGAGDARDLGAPGADRGDAAIGLVLFPGDHVRGSAR
jgi:hypothetical protein